MRVTLVGGQFVLDAGRGHERFGVAAVAAPAGVEELVGAGRVPAAVAAVGGDGVALLGVVVAALEVSDRGQDRRGLGWLSARGGGRRDALVVVPGVIGVRRVVVDERREVVTERAVPAGDRGGLPRVVGVFGNGAVPPDERWGGDGGRCGRVEQGADGGVEQLVALLVGGVLPAHLGWVDADQVGVAIPLRGLHGLVGEGRHGVGEPVGVGIGVGADRRCRRHAGS